MKVNYSLLNICVLCLVAILNFSCRQKLPPLEKRVWIDFEHELTGDTLNMVFKKIIPGPISIKLKSDKMALDTFLQPISPIIMNKAEVEVYSIPNTNLDTTLTRRDFNISVSFGDPYGLTEQDTLSWPFPKGKRYKILQGYNGSFSHTGPGSRYAIDFNLKVGDTICAAADGLVMEVLQSYNVGGKHQRYHPYANVITVVQKDGYIAQYVHLQQNGAIVAPGDPVKRGQAIGLSGLTGFTAGPHLHFNIYKPEVEAINSHPVIFEQMAGKDLKRGMMVGH